MAGRMNNDDMLVLLISPRCIRDLIGGWRL